MAMSPTQIENYVSGSGGGGGGGAFGLSIITSGIVTAIQEIEQGRIAQAQADYNAALMEGKAKWIDFQKGIAARQYNRLRGKAIGKTVAATAGAGLRLSGSPLAVMIDTATQINIDKAITLANMEQEKTYTKSAAEMYRVEGRNAVRQATTNAFSSLLQSGSKYALYKSGALDLSGGANRAGRI